MSRVARKSSCLSTPQRCVVTFVMLLASIFGFGFSSVAIAATTQTPRVLLGVTLTDTTLGTGTQLDFVDMVSTSLGYGVAALASGGRGTAYLVKTTDVGSTWTTQSALPFSMSELLSPAGYSPYRAGNAPAIHFFNAHVGYALAQGGSLFVTRDAGARWTRVHVPGVWPSYAIRASTLTVVSGVCARHVASIGPVNCASDLSQLSVGSTTPTTTRAIALMGTATRSNDAAELASVNSSSIVVVEGGGEGRRSSLLATSNSGTSWHLLSNPCGEVTVDRLLTSIPSHWLLHCFLDGGMTQGTSELWASSNEGTSWSIVARSTMGGSDHSAIGDMANSLYFSAQHSVLFGALGGAAGGLEYSTDWGARWRMAKIQTNFFGGAPEYLSAFDTSSALFGIVGGPQYRTSNGISWTELPLLPAGKYRGDAICTSSEGTTVRLHSTMTGIPSTTLDLPVIFTNNGDVPCYLNGVPSVQPLGGSTRSLVGGVAYPAQGNGGGGFVILKAHRGVASIVVESDQASYYPRSYCVPKTMTGIDVTFSSPSAFYLSMPHRSVCTGVSTLRNGGVVKGVVTWL